MTLQPPHRARRGPLSRITNAAAGVIDVNEIVDRLDVNEIVERIDVNEVVERIDVGSVIDRVDPEQLLDRIDPDALLDRVDPDRLLDRVDPNALLDRVDPDRLLDRVDPNALLDRVDPNALLDRVDPDRLLDRVDPDRLLDRVDVNRVLGRVDPDALLDRVDPNPLLDRVDPNPLLDRVDPNPVLDRVDANGLLDRVDPNALLERVDPDVLLDRVDVNDLLARVDPNALLDRVDPNALLDRVDVDRLMERVDIRGLVDRAGVAEIVGEGTGQVAGSVLDAVRRQIVAIDEIVGRVAYRLINRKPDNVAEGPPKLIDGPSSDKKGRGVVQGHYAGPVSRLAAFLIDVFVAFGLYTLTSAAIVFFGTGILGIQPPDISFGPALALAALVTWAFLYEFVSLLLVGRTAGKGLVGLMVVSADGTTITWKQAFVRVFTKPVSFLFFGVGLLGIAFGSTRQAWHDKFARTAVVYDWGDRSAALPAPLTQWINRHGNEVVADGQ